MKGEGSVVGRKEINPGDIVFLRCTVSEMQAGYGNMVRLETSDSVVYANRRDIMTVEDIITDIMDDGK